MSIYSKNMSLLYILIHLSNSIICASLLFKFELIIGILIKSQVNTIKVREEDWGTLFTRAGAMMLLMLSTAFNTPKFNYSFNLNCLIITYILNQLIFFFLNSYIK